MKPLFEVKDPEAQAEMLKFLQTKPKVVESLRSAICTVEFTKKDGTSRLMECTLDQQYLPAQEVVTESTVSKKPRKPLPDNLIRVYDIDVAGWRTINLDTINVFIQN